MELIKIHDINKKDIPLHYRNEFSGRAQFSQKKGPAEKQHSHPIEFAVERSALGKTEITVRVLGEVDYPLVPLIKRLKTHITDLYQKGLLP